MSGGKPPAGSLGRFDSKQHLPRDRVRQRTHESTWTKLAETVPKNEEGWRIARQQHAFSTPEDMLNTLEELLDGRKKSHLYVIVYLASRYTILCGDSSQKDTVYLDLRELLGNPKLQDNMLVTYMNSVVKLVKALDDLFLKGLLHRAFEVVLYIPIQISHLRLYGPNRDQFVSFFSIQKPPAEIQGSLLLSIPFLVHRLFPQLSLTSIQKAFGTTLHSPAEYCIFESAIEAQSVIPRLPLRHFEVLNIPRSLLSATLNLATKLRGYNPMPPYIPGSTQMYCYQWPDEKNLLTDKVWTILTSQNLLKEGEHRLSKGYAIHHDDGHLPTPDNHVQVVIPVVGSAIDVSQVSLGLGLDDGKWTNLWDAGQWIVMKPGTFLLPKRPVDYLALLFLVLKTDLVHVGKSGNPPYLQDSDC
ncbi:hypothetical protein Forpe1208_v016344 [Fusarium oxysporum f. sp. rapae]|uniref:Uncharacterized protein n=1 Tax=Fusarium oxysporum f. sp. rapae TaxID=485398 RepID=A0A8J5NKD8_FUSOX|nr:hypothetical protein Forpe1208_v016344 [Fusarium oxysporum f. sp. rapae]